MKNEILQGVSATVAGVIQGELRAVKSDITKLSTKIDTVDEKAEKAIEVAKEAKDFVTKTINKMPVTVDSGLSNNVASFETLVKSLSMSGKGEVLRPRRWWEVFGRRRLLVQQKIG